MAMNIDTYKQGNNWVINYWNETFGAYYEKQLPYYVNTASDVVDYCKECFGSDVTFEGEVLSFSFSINKNKKTIRVCEKLAGKVITKAISKFHYRHDFEIFSNGFDRKKFIEYREMFVNE